MSKILVLGANGQIARLAEEQLINETNDKLVLFLRNAQRLADMKSDRVQVIDGDTTSITDLKTAMQGVDVVYANLAGNNIKEQAEAVVKSMQDSNLSRLIWISTLGIYDEVPGKFGEWNNATLGSYLTTYRSAADVIEDSNLKYTVIRPAWLTNHDEVDYEVTHKGDDFKGTEVSRKSIADVVVKITQDPTLYEKESIGVNKPNTDGDKPSWY